MPRPVCAVCVIYAVVILVCASQTPTLNLTGPTALTPVCESTQASVCLVYGLVQWAAAPGADYQVVISIRRSMLPLPLELRRVSGNVTSSPVLFMLDISDSEYMWSASLVRAGSTVGNDSTLKVALPNVVIITKPVTITSGRPLIDPCGYVHNLSIIVSDVYNSVRRSGVSLYLSQDWDLSKEAALDSSATTIDLEIPAKTEWRVVALTIEEEPLALISDHLKLVSASNSEGFTRISAHAGPPSYLDVDDGDFLETLTIKIDDPGAFNNALQNTVYGLDINLCWNDGSHSLRVLTAVPPTVKGWIVNLPLLTSDFEYDRSFLFYVHIMSRSFKNAGSSSYSQSQYFAVSNAFEWLPGYLLQLADKGICLSYDSVNLTVIIRGCNATDIKQRFEYDPVSHLIKYVGVASQGGMCLRTLQPSGFKLASSPVELKVSPCNAQDQDQIFHTNFRSCSTKSCQYVVYQNRTEATLVPGSSTMKTRCLVFLNSKPMMRLTTGLFSICNYWISAGFPGGGRDIGVRTPEYSLCWTVVSQAVKLATCHASKITQKFTYSRNRILQVSDGTSTLCVDSFSLRVAACDKPARKFVYDPLTAQVAVISGDGTVLKCLDARGTNGLGNHNCLGINVRDDRDIVMYSFAFYGSVSVQNAIRVMAPRASREWFVNSATGAVAGFVSWDAANTESDLEVWISLVYEMNSMQSPTTTAIGRSVLSQSHRNSGFYGFESREMSAGNELLQVEVLVPGKPPATSDLFRIHAGRLELIRPTALEYDYVAKKLRGSMTWKYMSASGGPNSVVDIFLYWSPQPVNITWIGNNGVASWINVNEFYTGDHYDLMYSFRTPDSQSCHCLQLANGITSDSNAWNAAVGVDLLSVGVLQAESYAVVVVSRPQFMYSWGTASITLTNLCNDSLGPEDGQISDSQIKASSSVPTSTDLRLNSMSGWKPSIGAEPYYVEISFSSPVIISAVATQGVDEVVERWISRFHLLYVSSGLTPYNRNGKLVVFDGNVNGKDIVYNKLPYPIEAVALRLVADDWGKSRGPGLRMELYGCNVSDALASFTTNTMPPTSATANSLPGSPIGKATTRPPKKGSDSNTVIYIGAGVGGVVILVVVVCILLCCCYYQRNSHGSEDISKPYTPKRVSVTSDELLIKHSQDSNQQGADSVVRYVRDTSQTKPVDRSDAYLTVMENPAADINDSYIDLDDVVAIKQFAAGTQSAQIISRQDLELGELMGSGEFGNVYRGKWKTNGAEVAVKALKAEVSMNAREDFLREASVMCSLDHPYLVALLGVSLEQPLLIVTEFAIYGALQDYLRKRNPRMELTPMDAVHLDQQLKYAGQIARAMNFLAKKRLVHRDLAARNVLVFSPNVVKVADFGLSRTLETDRDYYTTIQTTKLPLKWMAPECWNKGKFTPLSDVWSFGVTLWEIMSYAARPYYGLQPQDVIAYVEAGKCLAKPDSCPDAVYKIMQSCWKFDPHERITFEELSQKLGSEQYVDVATQSRRSRGVAGPVMIDYSALTMGKDLGEGAFGSVMQASWKQPDGTNKEVAVKSISQEARPNDRDAFLKEASMMVSLRHRNIVQMLGISLPPGTKSLLVVSELIPLGNLLDYLKRNQLQDSKLKMFAQQIASGMAYLEEARIIHRDLAARNVLVAASDIVKVSDFGMSKALGMTQEYYRVSGPDKIPIRWVAPESILYFKFSNKSDVWSFGVTMWEMWCGGAMPWAGVATTDLVMMLESGKRLEQPRGIYNDQACCEDVWRIMNACWQYDPNDRPDFAQLKEQLTELCG
ncbi:uncharacterized protein LOC134191860 isoform X2 [Corticium candelabrum]|uniref:uncharacterized protein LOC134191860 isoform X2 n=1 Tax=Corticium candelabrum TaxID=121492 RepID=UPI002E269B9F|nr:uncharacterized protein LOC134191860 isoform X2 [Corticium candelabrum]